MRFMPTEKTLDYSFLVIVTICTLFVAGVSSYVNFRFGFDRGGWQAGFITLSLDIALISLSLRIKNQWDGGGIWVPVAFLMIAGVVFATGNLTTEAQKPVVARQKEARDTMMNRVNSAGSGLTARQVNDNAAIANNTIKLMREQGIGPVENPQQKFYDTVAGWFGSSIVAYKETEKNGKKAREPITESRMSAATVEVGINIFTAILLVVSSVIMLSLLGSTYRKLTQKYGDGSEDDFSIDDTPLPYNEDEFPEDEFITPYCAGPSADNSFCDFDSVEEGYDNTDGLYGNSAPSPDITPKEMQGVDDIENEDFTKNCKFPVGGEERIMIWLRRKGQGESFRIGVLRNAMKLSSEKAIDMLQKHLIDTGRVVKKGVEPQVLYYVGNVND